MVRSVVPVDGPVGGPLAVRSVVRSLVWLASWSVFVGGPVGGPVRGLVDGPVCRLVGALGGPACPVDGPVGCPVGCLVSGVVGDLVGDPVGGLVGGPVCGQVDGAVCGPVRASVSNTSCSILHTMAGRLPDAWASVAQAAVSGIRTVDAVALQCCGRVAAVLRWSGQWSQSMVRSVVTGNYGPLVRLAVRSVVQSVVRSVVWFVVWSMVQQCVVCSVRSLLRRNTSCSTQWPASFKCLDIGRKGLCSFVTFVILRSPDLGPCTLCPQNVVRAASWRRGVCASPRGNCF